jgi:two-component system CheB/CheR fusion protein
VQARGSKKRASGATPATPAAVAQRASEPPDHHDPADPTIVAVGASAGGLEAFSQVLEHVAPGSDLAFVFIQHLSPQHASALPELLSAKTSLPVKTAVNRTRIEGGHVYVIPPNVHMEVVDGELHLLPRPTDRTQFTPVDFFMLSVARWAQERVIGVILSGTASDGAAGIREIKALGGITIAQKPETARYDGMPSAALATGMVDLVLSPSEIGEQLSQVRRHPYLGRSGDSHAIELPISDSQLRDLFAALRRASGIDFRQYKTPTVRRRLLRRMALLRLTDLDAYLRHILESPAEAKALSHDLLIHVTRFFRDRDSFEAIGAHVFSELLKDRGEDPLRIWVPGCATGEEAYSVGICLLEALGDRATERRIQIFATDVSDGAIERARSGVYPVSIAADVSPERLKRYFTKQDGGFRVVKPLRDMCVFARHDLTRDPPFSRLDFILCRNVLIYLDVSLQKRLITVFHYALKSRGFLMLGPAETPGPQAFFSVVDKKWKLFRKMPADAALPLTLPGDLQTAVPPVTPKGRVKFVAEGKSVQDEATRLILDRYGPSGVIVDANLQIIQFRGHTGPYLEAGSGEPNLGILKMARGGLLHPLRSALTQAKRRSRIVRKEHVHVQRNGDWAEITLEVVPLTTTRGEHYLILFDESAVPSGAKAVKGGQRTEPPLGREVEVRVSDLRRELAASREYLQSIIQELEAANEELQSANEEILSSNEELQSTNEELDTAKEELQSTNEELNTVNEELHSRNEELTRANSDLTNLLGSVDIPIVIVGGDLGIRRFTPRAEQLFNLISSDVGRPIGQINPNFALDDLAGLIRETIDSIVPREREVQEKTGRWLSLRIRPYKGVDNRLDGAVISVFDIDANKKHQTFVEQSRDHFRAIVDAVRQPLLVLDGQRRIRSANRQFYTAFNLNPAQVEGRDLAYVGEALWDGNILRGLTEEALTMQQSAERLVDTELPGYPRQPWRFTASPIPLDDGQHGIVIAIEKQGANAQRI